MNKSQDPETLLPAYMKRLAVPHPKFCEFSFHRDSGFFYELDAYRNRLDLRWRSLSQNERLGYGTNNAYLAAAFVSSAFEGNPGKTFYVVLQEITQEAVAVFKGIEAALHEPGRLTNVRARLFRTSLVDSYYRLLLVQKIMRANDHPSFKIPKRIRSLFARLYVELQNTIEKNLP